MEIRQTVELVMKSILMVAFHYPPEGSSSGVLRTLKYTKYLPEFNWQSHVLTLTESHYPEKNPELLNEIPEEVHVHRTHAFNSAKHFAIRGRYLALLAIPDRFVSWWPFGVVRGVKIIKKWPIQALYSTSPQPTTHLIAGWLKKLTKLPWVADFRDPWIEEGLYPVPGTLQYKLESKLENWVIQSADHVTVTTARLKEDFLRRYPNISPQKISVIHNGYDEADFQKLQHTNSPEHFEIIHAGLITQEYRNPFPLLKAVSQILRKGKAQGHRIRVTFLGGGGFLHSKAFQDMVGSLGLNEVVHVEPRVPNSNALLRMAGAAVLLLLQATEDTSTLIPAKAFEYLRINKPILAVTGNGATADLLMGFSDCYVHSADDSNGMFETIQELFSRWSQGVTTGKTRLQDIQQYERRNLSWEFSQILNRLVGSI